MKSPVRLLPSVLLAVGLLVLLTGTITFAGPSSALPVIDDFEDGLPGAWFQYGDYGSGTVIETNVIATDTVPGMDPNQVLEIAYTSAGWGAGTGHDLGGQDWSQYDGFSFWFQGAATGATFRIILSDNPNPDVPGDSAERFAYEWVDDSAGWQFVQIPWAEFFRDYAFQPPGAPDDGLTLTEVQAYALALPTGTSATVYLDHVSLYQTQTIDGFEDGLPGTWFQYGDYGSGTVINTTVVATDTVPGLDPNNVLEIDYTSAGWGAGTGNNLGGQDWSQWDGLSFWFYGSASDAVYRVILSDNPNPDVPGDSAERFAYEFADDSAGWRLVSIPWAEFFRDYAYQPPGAPDDGLTLTEVQAYALALPGGSRVTYLDEVALFGSGEIEVQVGFSANAYSVAEGESAEITVVLNAPAEADVSVDYATADGTGVEGVDYVAAAGTLVFPAGETEQTFTVDTIDNAVETDDLTVLLALSDADGAALGARSEAVLTIADNDAPVVSGKSVIIDDFEDGMLPTGEDANGIGIGFITWNAPGAGVDIAITDSPPAPVPNAPDGNLVLQEDLVLGPGQWAGFSHAFANEALDEWVPQDWSSYAGFSFWLYGNNTGGTMFVDILDNRNPGSTTDDAERWSIDIPDDFSGWQQFQIPWEDFHRKDIGNGAPNDGFTLTEVWGYGIGGFGSVDMGSQSYFVDDVGLLVRTTVIDDFEDGQLPSGEDANGIGIGFITWNAPSAGVDIAITDSPPAAVPGAAEGNLVLQETLVLGPGQWAGFSHAFANEALDEWVTQDWSTYEGICFWLYGNNTGGVIFLDVLDNRNPGSTSDDAERWSIDIPDDFAGWKFIQIPFADLHRKEIGNGAPDDGLTLTEVHGYGIGGFGSVDMGEQQYYIDDVAIYGQVGGEEVLQAALDASAYDVVEGDAAAITVSLNMSATVPVTVGYRTAESYAVPDRNFVPVEGELVFAPGETEQQFVVETLDNNKHQGELQVMLNLTTIENAEFGFQRRAVLRIEDNDPMDPALLDDFQGWQPFQTTGDVDLAVMEIAQGDPMAVPGQGAFEDVLRVDYDATAGPVDLLRTYPEGQDWSDHSALGFWFNGTGSGETVTVQILDNQSVTTADVDPSQWTLVWSDEFDEPAGTSFNSDVWSAEIGDGTMNGIPGWGNSEFEYYTDSTDNVATDGEGNLVITLNAEDSDKLCWYGPCEYTSARLISADKAEFAYGRVEARVWVPTGPAGLWPAFWMLGTNIGEVGWPQSGEIDIMEYVSRTPDEVFGTIHGPGYSGGASFGGTYNFPEGVAGTYHTFAVEWAPDEIHWYVDGINYHDAMPEDVAPNEWVFNHPFYVILNLAIGGNFGGAISDDMTYPQEMKVDYVRVYQAASTAERFEASFVDDAAGWQQVVLPFSDFVRSADQPEGAPDDGFGLTEVWGYGLQLPDGVTGQFYLDQVRLTDVPSVIRSRRYDMSADTFIDGNRPTLNFGDASTMWVGFSDQLRPLVQADIPICDDVHTCIPADSAVDKAYLYVYVAEGRGYPDWFNSVIEVSAHAVQTSWDEATATWNTPWFSAGGDFGPALDTLKIGTGRIGTWWRFDVTDAVAAIISGQMDNNGFVLTSNYAVTPYSVLPYGLAAVRYGLASSEYWDPGKVGYLRVMYRTFD